MSIVRQIGPYFAYVYRGTCPMLRMIRAVPMLESGDNAGSCNHFIFTHGSHLVSIYNRGSRTLPNTAEHSRILLNTAEYGRILPDSAECYRTVSNNMGHFRIAQSPQCIVVTASPDMYRCVLHHYAESILDKVFITTLCVHISICFVP